MKFPKKFLCFLVYFCYVCVKCFCLQRFLKVKKQIQLLVLVNRQDCDIFQCRQTRSSHDISWKTEAGLHGLQTIVSTMDTLGLQVQAQWWTQLRSKSITFFCKSFSSLCLACRPPFMTPTVLGDTPLGHCDVFVLPEGAPLSILSQWVAIYHALSTTGTTNLSLVVFQHVIDNMMLNCFHISFRTFFLSTEVYPSFKKTPHNN